MIEFNGLNIWTIVLAWLLNVVIGSLWYSPALFGKLWSKLSGVDMLALPKDEATRAIGFVMLSAVVQSVVLNVIFHSLRITSVVDGLEAGLLLWAGLVAATTVGNNLYSRLSWKFWWLNASFFLVVMTINSILIAIWS